MYHFRMQISGDKARRKSSACKCSGVGSCCQSRHIDKFSDVGTSSPTTGTRAPSSGAREIGTHELATVIIVSRPFNPSFYDQLRNTGAPMLFNTISNTTQSTSYSTLGALVSMSLPPTKFDFLLDPNSLPGRRLWPTTNGHPKAPALPLSWPTHLLP
jgi:hypothetical protein